MGQTTTEGRTLILEEPGSVIVLREGIGLDLIVVDKYLYRTERLRNLYVLVKRFLIAGPPFCSHRLLLYFDKQLCHILVFCHIQAVMSICLYILNAR